MSWCDHTMVKYRNGMEPPGDWKFCPVCGAKRPERKGLAEKFLTAIAEHRAFGMGGCTIEDKCQRENLAQTAIDHTCEVIDEYCEDEVLYVVSKEGLKKALRDSI